MGEGEAEIIAFDGTRDEADGGLVDTPGDDLIGRFDRLFRSEFELQLTVDLRLASCVNRPDEIAQYSD